MCMSASTSLGCTKCLPLPSPSSTPTIRTARTQNEGVSGVRSLEGAHPRECFFGAGQGGCLDSLRLGFVKADAPQLFHLFTVFPYFTVCASAAAHMRVLFSTGE